MGNVEPYHIQCVYIHIHTILGYKLSRLKLMTPSDETTLSLTIPQQRILCNRATIEIHYTLLVSIVEPEIVKSLVRE